MTTKPTHRERKKCELRVRELADYMASSQQVRRSVLRGFRYQKIAPRIQHKEARIVIADWLQGGHSDLSTLTAAAEKLRSRLATSSFEGDQNDFNADYIEAFLEAFPEMKIPTCEMAPAGARGSVNLNGTNVIYNPDVVVKRKTVKNTRKIGAIFLRYSKNKELPEKTGDYQSAFAFGFLKDNPFEPEAEPERALCMTIDGNSGRIREAPGKSIYFYNEMSAACADIADLWPKLEPPTGAIFD